MGTTIKAEQAPAISFNGKPLSVNDCRLVAIYFLLNTYTGDTIYRMVRGMRTMPHEVEQALTAYLEKGERARNTYDQAVQEAVNEYNRQLRDIGSEYAEMVGLVKMA